MMIAKFHPIPLPMSKSVHLITEDTNPIFALRNVKKKKINTKSSKFPKQTNSSL